jgi:hypothetical protein
MARMASFQCGTQCRTEEFTRPYSASNPICATGATAALPYMARILRYRRISGTNETKIESIPSEAIAKINFFIRFTSYSLRSIAAKQPFTL